MDRSGDRMAGAEPTVTTDFTHWTDGSPQHHDADVARRVGVLTVLAAGFAVVFGLWLLWGYQLVLSLRQMERNLSGVHDSYVRGEEILTKVRTNVLLGS